MRILLIVLSLAVLAGCSAPRGQDAAVSSRIIAVPLFQSQEELAGRAFNTLGEVSGESCQFTLQDNPANLAAARRDMQMRAAQMQGNAVLLHQCQIFTGVAGCYRQAICQGSALNLAP